MNSKMHPYQDTSLSFEERARDLISRFTLEEKANMLTAHMHGVPRLGVEECHAAVEIARGLVMRKDGQYSTVLPQPYGMAAMFDDELMERLGEMAGNETRIYYHRDRSAALFMLGPTVDMERDPRWGRNEEAYGEDPCLTAKMAGAYTIGLAGKHPKYVKTVPILKHFYANNYENERLTANSCITPRLKDEYYMKVFESIIRRGRAFGVMTSYNMINGVEAVSNPEITSVCKDKWGMLFAVSDGGDFAQNVTHHETYKDHADAIADMLGFGADIMLDNNAIVAPAALEAYKRGILPEENIDEALYSIFLARFMTGEFDPKEANPYANIDEALLNSDEHKALAELAARKSVILLENDGILPLCDDGKKIVAVVGPLANENYLCWYCGLSESQTSIAEGFRNRLGSDRVLFDEGLDRIAIRSVETGKYLSIKDDGRCIADSNAPGDNEIFELNDWDFDSWTLRSIKTGKYLTESVFNPGASDQMTHFPTKSSISCSAERAFGWFVKELFNFKKYDGDFTFFTWQGREVCTGENGELISVLPSRMTNNKRFVVDIISSGQERVAELAKKADTVIVCAGNQPMINAREEYDRPDIQLPKSQTDILRVAAQANTDTILYLVSSYPFSINKDRKLARAVIHSSHIGPSLGKVAADTVFGDNNPAGRCPSTWYSSIRELPGLNDYDIMKNKTTYLYYDGEPLYAFGYGLSYTSFQYDNLRVQNDSGKVLRATVNVRNTGTVDGEEVVQLYVTAPKSVFTRPIKELKAFKRVSLRAGEAADVELDFLVEDLMFLNTSSGERTVEKGEYSIQIGASSADIRCKKTILIDGEVIPGKSVDKRMSALHLDGYDKHEFLTDQDGKEYIRFKNGAGLVLYKNLLAEGYNRFEAIISTPMGNTELLLLDNKTSRVIGRMEPPITGSCSEFISCICEVEPPEGLLDLAIVSFADISLKEFRFFNSEECK